MSDEFSGRLSTVAKVSNEFEAEAIVIVLRDAGVPALAQPTSDSLSRRPPEVHVRVRAGDADRAQEALRARRQQANELGWETDDEPRIPRRMPLPARISYVVALIVVAATIITMVLVLVL